MGVKMNKVNKAVWFQIQQIVLKEVLQVLVSFSYISICKIDCLFIYDFIVAEKFTGTKKQVAPVLEEDHHDLEEGSAKADAVQAAVPVHKINEEDEEEADEAEAVVGYEQMPGSVSLVEQISEKVSNWVMSSAGSKKLGSMKTNMVSPSNGANNNNSSNGVAVSSYPVRLSTGSARHNAVAPAVATTSSSSIITSPSIALSQSDGTSAVMMEAGISK